MNPILKFAPLAVAASLAFGTAAQASFTVYTDQAAFLAAVTNAGTDTFDDLVPGPVASPIERIAGAYSYTASAGPNSGFFPGSDGGDVFLSTDNRLDTITFSNFSDGVDAVGGFFFGSDIGGFPTPATSITLIATDADGSITETIFNPTTGSFLGFVSTGGFASLDVLIGDEIGVWPSVDDLVLASVEDVVPGIPEPATWAMMIAGFGLVGGAMRRRATTVAA